VASFGDSMTLPGGQRLRIIKTETLVEFTGRVSPGVTTVLDGRMTGIRLTLQVPDPAPLKCQADAA
jgi:hypothetical protein